MAGEVGAEVEVGVVLVLIFVLTFALTYVLTSGLIFAFAAFGQMRLQIQTWTANADDEQAH